MTTKPNRHAVIETTCQWCGIKFMARKQRVDKGQSRFCSREHHREWLKAQGSQRKNIGKENAIVQWDKSVNMYRSYWYDENSKYHSEPWAKWAWELNFGEVPEGYRVSYKDKNPKNNTIENICLKTPSELSDIGDRSRGVLRSVETKIKLSKSHLGKILSDEHKKHIGDASRKRWGAGLFDMVHKGQYNKHWRGGVPSGYPKEFNELRAFIRERDRYMCQICGKHLHKTRDCHVHHIDGNRKHNDPDNLKLLCTSCHGLIHSNKPASPPILAFRSMLEWNQPEEQ